MKAFSIFLLLLCCSCSNKETKVNQTIKLPSSIDPISFDPRIAGDSNSQATLRLVYEGLTRIEPDGKPHLAVASNVEISEDKKVYTFKLKDTFWSDGSPLTAYDFERSWKQAVSLDFPTKYSYAFFCIEGVKAYRNKKISIEKIGIKALDQTTLEIRLSNPIHYFLELLANPVFSPVHPNYNTFVSNGPYRLVRWVFKNKLILKKNPYYWNDSNVCLNTIEINVVKNAHTANLLYENDELDWTGEPLQKLPIDTIQHWKDQKELCIRPPNPVKMVVCNTENNLMSNEKIRRALAISIDRKDITEHFLEGNEIPAHSVLPPHLTLQEKALFNDKEIEEAKRLLHEGLSELNIDINTIGPIMFIHSNTNQKLPQILQEQWKENLEINVKLLCMDWPSCLKKYKSKDFQIMLFGWESWINDPIYNLRLNELLDQKIDTEIEDLLSASDKETDSIKRLNLLRESEKRLVDKMYVIPIYFGTRFYLQKPYVKGVYYTPLDYPDFTYVSVDHSKS